MHHYYLIIILSSLSLSVQFCTHTNAHTILHKLDHIIHVDLIKVNILLYFISFFHLSDSFHTHALNLRLTPIPLPCLLVYACFESSHNPLYAQIVIYIHRYTYALLRGS